MSIHKRKKRDEESSEDEVGNDSDEEEGVVKQELWSQDVARESLRGQWVGRCHYCGLPGDPASDPLAFCEIPGCYAAYHGACHMQASRKAPTNSQPHQPSSLTSFLLCPSCVHAKRVVTMEDGGETAGPFVAQFPWAKLRSTGPALLSGQGQGGGGRCLTLEEIRARHVLLSQAGQLSPEVQAKVLLNLTTTPTN